MLACALWVDCCPTAQDPALCGCALIQPVAQALVFSYLRALPDIGGLAGSSTGNLPLQVYRHHCVGQLSEKHRRMRDCALYIAGNVNATKWALELYGFRDVAIPIQAMQMSDSVDGTVSPVLLNVRLSIRLSL